MTTATAPFVLSLPSEADLVELFQPFREVTEAAIRLRHAVCGPVDRFDTGDEPERYATFEELGRLFVFLEAARDRLVEARGYVDKALAELGELADPCATDGLVDETEGRAVGTEALREGDG